MYASNVLPATQQSTTIVTTADVSGVVHRYFSRDEFCVAQKIGRAAASTGGLGMLGLGLMPIALPSLLYGVKRSVYDLQPKDGLSIMAAAVALPPSSPALLGVSVALWGIAAASVIPGILSASGHDAAQATG